MQEQIHILCFVENHIGWIQLKRSKSLNALSQNMLETIQTQLQAWKHDEEVFMVVLYSDSEKAFCSGGDILSLYENRNDQAKETAFAYFITEYNVDLAIHHYPKPILAYMHGITMGGGVGLVSGCDYRIVTEKTTWAMPETNIGFFTDVGASYFLNQMPGYTGRYLGLTATNIGAADTIYTGAANRFMPSSNWEAFKQSLRDIKWSGPPNKQIQEQLNIYTTEPPSSELTNLQSSIDQHFSHDTIEKIITSLEEEGKSEWAQEVLAKLKAKSPTSLKVVLQQLQRGQEKTLLNCFRMEAVLSMNMSQSHDFYEGVRAMLIEKDKSPQWRPSTLRNVLDQDVLAVFEGYSEASEAITTN